MPGPGSESPNVHDRRPTGGSAIGDFPPNPVDPPFPPPVPGRGEPSFFESLAPGEDLASKYRQNLAAQRGFHADLAEHSQVQARVAGRNAKFVADHAISEYRQVKQVTEAADKARQEATERIWAAEAHRKDAATFHQLAELYDEGAQPLRASTDGAGLAESMRQRAAINRGYEKQELDRAKTVQAEADRFAAQADELDARSQQLRVQAEADQGEARTLWAQQRSAERQMGQSRERDRAYKLLGKHFDVPPPPPLGGGDHVIVYDHDAIDAGVRELNQIAARAQANLDAAHQARLKLKQDATGASTEAAQQPLIRVEQVNRRIIAAVAGALRDLGAANHDMAHLDRQNAAGYN